MNAYEEHVIREWMRADARPPALSAKLVRRLTGRVRGLLRAAEGSPDGPVAKLMDRVRLVAREAITRTLEHSATASQLARVEARLERSGSHATSAAEIRMLPLQVKDAVARELAKENTVTVAAEGMVAGLTASLCECIPGLQALTIPTILADIAASLYLLAQNAVRIGYSYGYDIDHPDDLPHFLMAMAPHTADAALIEAKWTAHVALRTSGSHVVSTVAEHASMRTLATNSPAISGLLDQISTRLALRIGEREWGLLIPVAGALVQGSVNAAFARSGSAQAVRYFQELHMVERYGAEYTLRQRHLLAQDTRA